MQKEDKGHRSYEELRQRVKNISGEEKMKEEEAFVLFILREFLGLEESIYDDAMDAGGPKDCGIDAFWVNDDEKVVYLLQCKYRSDKNTINENEIDNFLNSIEYLKAPPISLQKRCKKYIQERSQEYKEYIGRLYDTRLIFATSSTYELAARDKTKIFNERNRNEDIQIELLDAKEIIERMDNFRRKDKPDIKFNLQNNYHEHRSKSIPYVVCSIFADDLALAYKAHKGNILEQNLRYGLKGGPINKQIAATLQDSRQRKNFWYYNNGITIICDDYQINKDFIAVQNAQIVNGAQTTKAVYEASMSLGMDALHELSILTRIIKTSKNEDLIEQIRDFNNKQNPTKPRDFISHRKEQQRLQGEFESLRYFYEIKRGEKYEETNAKRIKRDKLSVIDNLTVAQAQCSFLGKPAQAKSEKSSLLDPSKEHYKEIFGEPTNARNLLLAYKCYEFAKESLKKFKKRKSIKAEEEFMLHGTTHIVAVMGKIIEKVVGVEKIIKDDEQFRQFVSNERLKLIYQEAVEFVEDLYSLRVDMYRSEELSFTPSRYFKNADEATKMLDKIDKKIDKNLLKLEKKILLNA